MLIHDLLKLDEGGLRGRALYIELDTPVEPADLEFFCLNAAVLLLGWAIQTPSTSTSCSPRTPPSQSKAPEGHKRGDYCVKEFERVPGATLARENFLQQPHAACVTQHDFGVPGSPECDFGPVTSTFWARTPRAKH